MRVAVVVALLAGVAAGDREFEPLYLGPSFDGMAFEGTQRQKDGTVHVFYGRCTPAADAPSCAVPLQVSTASICRSNPLEDDSPEIGPVTRIAGVPVVGGAVLTGRVEVLFQGELRRADLGKAIRALRPVGQAEPRTAPPERARLPRWVLRELALTVQRRRRVRSPTRLARQLGISRKAVRLRLDLAEALGPKGLDGVAPATAMPGETVKDRHALLGRREGHLPEGTRESRRRLERRADRHAERQRRC